jgi:RNA polymerase subunit RPABC4/transcription elongation factor Spt4
MNGPALDPNRGCRRCGTPRQKGQHCPLCTQRQLRRQPRFETVLMIHRHQRKASAS